jgi:hypothetical protein
VAAPLVELAFALGVVESKELGDPGDQLAELTRAQPGERGYPGGLRRRDHTKHSKIISPVTSSYGTALSHHRQDQDPPHLEITVTNYSGITF